MKKKIMGIFALVVVLTGILGYNIWEGIRGGETFSG